MRRPPQLLAAFLFLAGVWPPNAGATCDSFIRCSKELTDHVNAAIDKERDSSGIIDRKKAQGIAQKIIDSDPFAVERLQALAAMVNDSKAQINSRKTAAAAFTGLDGVVKIRVDKNFPDDPSVANVPVDLTSFFALDANHDLVRQVKDLTGITPKVNIVEFHELGHNKDILNAVNAIDLFSSDSKTPVPEKFKAPPTSAPPGGSSTPKEDSSAAAVAAVVKNLKNDPTLLPAIEEEARKKPGDAKLQTLLSLGRLVNGDEEGSREAARKAAALDPKNKLAELIIGHPEAFSKANAKLGSFENTFLGRQTGGMDDGAVRALPGDRKSAEAALAAMAAGVGPGEKAQALLQSALEMLSVGDFKGALFTLSRALLNDPKNVRARILRAHISNQLKNYGGALKDLDEALKLDPKNAAALFEKGYAQLQMGQVASALATIEEGLKIAPNDPMGRLYHAMALEKSGLIAAAIAEYKRAAELDPSLRPIVDDALAKLADVQSSMPKLPRKIQTKYVLWLFFFVAALALLLEGGKRLFYKDWKTTVTAKPDEKLPATAGGTLAPGTVLGGNFRVEGEIARGGIGIVYKATDLTLKRVVAIKHLSREAYESGEVRERFLKEAQLAAKLRHRNLAEIFSVVGAGELYLVFEFVDGVTLHQRLVDKRRLSIEELKPIVKDIAEAVDYAHSQKVIHRDLKPANVMITAGGHVKVMDFGIAKETRSENATQTQAWGTPPYMAPEQEMGSVCKESDLYALGVMIYELVAGERPFKGAYSLDQKLKKEFRPIKHANPDAPGELHAFFQKALDPDPKNRFHSAAEMARAIAAIEPTPIRG